MAPCCVTPQTLLFGEAAHEHEFQNDTQRLILASNNAGKLKEFNQLLATVGYSVHAQGEYNVPEADEPFHTFVENALQKARHASGTSYSPCA